MLNLNQDSIYNANNASMFEAGSALAREAEHTYQEGVDKMQAPFKKKEPNDVQAGILASRLTAWKELVEKAYNDIISRRAAWVPWTVSGPANYPAKRMNAKADAQMNAANEWDAKMNRFIENTLSMLRDAIPHEQMLAEYRSGERREPIPGDDPAALEKLTARLEGMKERHELKKKINAWWRKHQTMIGCPDISEETAKKIDSDMKNHKFHIDIPFASYSLSNGLAEIKRIEERIKTISAQRETGDAEQVYDGFTVQQSAAEGRINITFDSKPEEAARNVLKSNGFHWSPRAKVWTRQLTPNALRAVKYYVVPGLLALDEYGEAEPEQPEATPENHSEPEQPATMTLDEFVAAANHEELASFVAVTLLGDAEREPLTYDAAYQAIRNWLEEGVELPAGITARALADEWNAQLAASAAQ